MTAASETRIPATPPFRCDGLRALVTGASGGIGRAAAIALAEAGAEVLLTARRAEPMQATADALAARGLRAGCAALDVTDRAAVAALVAARGPFEVLVNNAGTANRRPFLDVPHAEIDALIALNVTAAFDVAQQVARGLVKAGRPGSVINVSSVNGHVAQPNRTLYTATKFFVEGMTKGMALELGPHGIRVNTLCPTLIETPLTETLVADPAVVAAARGRIPLGRIGQVEDLMGAVVFLASPAAALITGHALLVDGGMTAH